MPAVSNAVMAAWGAVFFRFHGVANLLSINLCFNGPWEKRVTAPQVASRALLGLA
jgi:hypothetical protein